MTNQHPLTDAICKELADTEDRPFTDIEMDNMRAAADWQLKQVVEFIKKEDTVYAEYIYKAMRP
ncbi:MAG: hypothetical protein ACO23H_10465, partial [Alphaproteobacteria bacterium]